MRILILLTMLTSSVLAQDLSSFVPQTGNVTAKFTKAQVAKMLGEGSTCVKDGVKVLYQSKNITKKHCQKAKYLKGIRVIKASNTDFYTELLGLK